MLRLVYNTYFIHKTSQSVVDPENFGGGYDKNFKHKTSKIRMCCNQAHSQKFAMEQLFQGSEGGAPSAQKF